MRAAVRTTIISAVMIATLLALGSTVAAERVYKWTDENGVVHFSASPPPDQQAERITVRSAPPTPVEAPEQSAGETPEGDLFSEAEQPDNSGIEEDNRRKQCQKGRNMIAQIEPRPRVFSVDKDGNRTYLADEERIALLQQARDLVAEHCNS